MTPSLLHATHRRVAYYVRINCPRKDVLALYSWLDVFCPSWEFEASSGGGDRSHSYIRRKNEETLSRFALHQEPDGPAQNKIEKTGLRVATEKEAMACRIHYLDCHVEPRGKLT